LIEPGATATSTTGTLRLGANQKWRGGAARKFCRRNVVGGVDRVEALNVDQLRDPASRAAASTGSGVARSNVSWSAFSARSASACATMQVILISDVEII